MKCQYFWKTCSWLHKLVIRTYFKHEIQYVTCYMQNSLKSDKTLPYLTVLTPMKRPFFSTLWFYLLPKPVFEVFIADLRVVLHS